MPWKETNIIWYGINDGSLSLCYFPQDETWPKKFWSRIKNY
jgi:hypothetical protein